MLFGFECDVCVKGGSSRKIPKNAATKGRTLRVYHLWHIQVQMLTEIWESKPGWTNQTPASSFVPIGAWPSLQCFNRFRHHNNTTYQPGGLSSSPVLSTCNLWNGESPYVFCVVELPLFMPINRWLTICLRVSSTRLNMSLMLRMFVIVGPCP